MIDAPGKSLGEIVLHWPERRIPVVSDAVVGDPPGKCKLLPDKVVDDPARQRDSARQLLGLESDILLVADGVPIRKAREILRELVETFYIAKRLASWPLNLFLPRGCFRNPEMVDCSRLITHTR